MSKITPHLWFDSEAVEAAELHASTFPSSRVTDVSTLRDTPTGDCASSRSSSADCGAVVVTPLSTNAWGIRGSRVRDPFGNLWWLQSLVEDVPEDEAARRMGEERYLEEMRISTETLDREVRRLCAGR